MRDMRIYKKDAVYYITVRAAEGKSLFPEEADFLAFREILEKRKIKYGFKLYAYCLLSSHYHILIEPANANISKIMQALNTSYSLYFNKKSSNCLLVFINRISPFSCSSSFNINFTTASNDVG